MGRLYVGARERGKGLADSSRDRPQRAELCTPCCTFTHPIIFEHLDRILHPLFLMSVERVSTKPHNPCSSEPLLFLVPCILACAARRDPSVQM